jgi:uncharacterized delta-60 repeat protein
LNGGPIFSTSLQLDGKIIIGGAFDSYIDATGSSIAKKNITRFNANGTLDQTFDSGTGASSFVQTTCIQNDGKIIICGSFDKYNSTTYVRVARVNTNGSIDNSFNSGCGVNPDNGYIRDIAIQNDGKILIGGDFKKYNGVEIGGVARLNNDGSIDNTFDSGLGIDHIVHSLSLQNDGKIIIGGQFTTFNGIIRKNIARINTNGSLDTTFNPGSGNTSGIVYTTSIQSDGKIIIGGDFTSFNGTSINRLARLSSTGAIDNSFNSSMGLGVISNSFPGDYPIINSTVTQADGKLIIAGKFNTFNNNTWNDTSRRHIARLNNTGSLDLTFNPGGGFNNPVSSNSIPVLNVTMQNDGKIIAVGTFTKYNGISRNRIVRINTNGSIDNSFDPGLGANDTIHAVAIQSDGKIIIAGNFTSYNGLPANQIARLNQDGSLDTIFKSGIGANQDILSTGIQNDGKIIIGGQFTAYNNMGRNRIARLFGGSAPIFPEPAGIITGSQNVCQGQNSVTYFVPLIANASSYLWTLPNGVTGTSNTNSITVNYGNSAISGNITVKGINTSGEGTPATLAITVTPLPSNPGMIDGDISVCQGQNSVNYSVPAIANATSYLWTLSNGMTGVSSTNSIFIDFNSISTSGEITVKGLNSCGSGTISSLSITVTPTVGSASNIIGLTNVCQGQSSVTYTLDPIENATSYNWLLPNGASGTSTINEITLDYGLNSTTDDIIVNGSNSCGNGESSFLTINVNPLPSNAGVISGSQIVCQGQNSLNYSVDLIQNADSYLWTLPNGAVGLSSSNSINIDYTNSALSGDIIVNGVNSCGNGLLSFLSINVNSIPESAGTIIGLTSVCQGQNSLNYTLPSITNASSYFWGLPSGATGSSSTNSILIDFGMLAISGNILVYGINVCGFGSPSTLSVTVNSPPTINTAPTNTQVNIGNPAIFSLNANSGSYQWQINNGSGFQNISNGGQFSGVTTNTLTVSNTTMLNNNNQFRCLVTANNCSTLSNEVVLSVINNAGLEESKAFNFLIVPNPIIDFFCLKTNQNQIGNTFELVDNSGRTVLLGKITSDSMLIDAGKLSRGIYNLNLLGAQPITMKLVKN